MFHIIDGRCEQTDKIVEKVAANNTAYSFVQVDTGVVDLAKKYFQVRVFNISIIIGRT